MSLCAGCASGMTGERLRCWKSMITSRADLTGILWHLSVKTPVTDYWETLPCRYLTCQKKISIHVEPAQISTKPLLRVHNWDWPEHVPQAGLCQLTSTMTRAGLSYLCAQGVCVQRFHCHSPSITWSTQWYDFHSSIFSHVPFPTMTISNCMLISDTFDLSCANYN